jgi:nucleoside-diphosphate-sugar epimerase
MKIVYVTGCLGFIGSYVTKACLEQGWYVYGIDSCTYASNVDCLNEFNSNPKFKFENVLETHFAFLEAYIGLNQRKFLHIIVFGEVFLTCLLYYCIFTKF